MASTLLSMNVLRSLFCVLGCLMTATLIYILIIDGLPFRKELLIPWMGTTLIDFYIIVVAIATWIAYKESNVISTIVWIILLVCLGSITTCAYVVLQLFKLSSQEASQDPMYYVLVRHNSKDDIEKKPKFSSVVAARIAFTALGCLMLGALIYTLLTDGSPFRRELLIPWMKALLVDLYINIVAMSVWVTYKESSLLGAFIWIILFICLGSFTICTYIVIQLCQLSSQDPLYLVLLNSRSREGFKTLISSLSSSVGP